MSTKKPKAPYAAWIDRLVDEANAPPHPEDAREAARAALYAAEAAVLERLKEVEERPVAVTFTAPVMVVQRIRELVDREAHEYGAKDIFTKAPDHPAVPKDRLATRETLYSVTQALRASLALALDPKDLALLGE